jgi:hypothetical protein
MHISKVDVQPYSWQSFKVFEQVSSVSMCVGSVDPSTDGKLNDSSGGEVTTTFSLPRLVNCSSKEYHLEPCNDFLIDNF